jgi:uncharacterized membrane protein YfcA
MIDYATLLVVAGALVGGFVNGLTGFGTAMTALPIWLGVLAPVLAAPLAIVCSIVGQLQTLPAIWHAMDWRRLWPFVAGGLLGVPAGTLLLPLVSPPVFKTAVGLLLVSACGFLLASGARTAWAGGGRLADGVVGLLGGVLGGLAGLSGMLPTLWAELRGWGKDARRAVFQGFNVTILLFALASHAVAGTLITAELGRLLLFALPATMLGAWLGRRLYTRLDARRFGKAVLVLLLIAGIGLIVSGLRGAR